MGSTVAIVIPTYNRADLLPEAIEASLAQATAPGLEVRVIVVDDGSSDDTEAVARRYGDRITYVRQVNAERGAARNHGARIAGAVDYLCFLDSDDTLAADHVARLVALSERHPEAPFVATRMRVTDKAGRPLYDLAQEPGPLTLEDLLLGGVAVNPSAAMIRRAAFEATGGYDPDRALAGSEDWLSFARLLTLAPARRDEGRTVRIRHHEGNSMNNAASMRRTMLEAHRRFFDDARGAAHERLRGPSRARLLLHSGVNWYVAGAPMDARADLARALREDPRLALDPRLGGKLAWTALRSLVDPRVTAWARGRKREVQGALSRLAGRR